jgi:lysophospholipase L1-like esterase
MSIEGTIEFVETSAPTAEAVRSHPAARRSSLRVIAADLAMLFLLLLASEIALQVCAPIYGHDYYDTTLTASHPVTFNADGFRGPAIPLAKQPGETRLLALGDSTTFGTGVGIEQTWPLQLRDLLADADAHPVTVMNVALQGESIADMTCGYEQRWAAYHPDVVTVLVSCNMVSLAWIQRNQPPQVPPYIMHAEPASTLKQRLSREAGRLCLPHFLSVNTQRALYWLGVTDHRIADPSQPFGALLAHGWRQGDIPTDEAEQAWACFARELAGLREATARHGAKLVVGFSPCRFDLSDSLFDNEKNVPLDRMTIDPADRLARLCAAQGIPCIDTLAALRSARRQLAEQRGHEASLYIMFDYNHLDSDGHAAVARAMLPLVRDLLH